jgi:hypothetical protein
MDPSPPTVPPPQPTTRSKRLRSPVERAARACGITGIKKKNIIQLCADIAASKSSRRNKVATAAPDKKTLSRKKEDESESKWKEKKHESPKKESH